MGDCPDEEAWLDFLELDREKGSDPRAFDAHLASCADCRALMVLLVEQRSEAPNPPSAGPRLSTANADVSGAIEGLRTLVDTHEDRRIGTKVAGKWEIEALLGAGGMGRVYRARHHNGHRVAIKFLHASLAAGNPGVVRRFAREGYAANRVGHPAIVRVLDDGDDDGPYLVMELLEGASCRSKLVETGPFTIPDALDVIETAADALAAAHRAGVIHRDVKPDNIFITTNGQVRLLDFGLASMRNAISAESATVDGVTVGTVGYMPPEQARGDNAAVTARSDVWSLAATCVALVTSRPIHDGKTPAEQLAFAVTKPAPPVRSLGAKLSGQVASVLDRALSFGPADRQADAAEFLAELRRARARRPKRHLAFVATGLAGFLVAASAVIFSRPHRAVVEPSPHAEAASVEVEPLTIPPPASATEPVPAPPVTMPSNVVSATARPARPNAPTPKSVPVPPTTTASTAAPITTASSTRDPLSPRF
ncbi:serine/threonine-protein kinase [Labilithrix luteola]|uniref:serine/threonine-protein kinase n=1 Tax=Labilithrix luteola TaxID=1391654 RepID=UPI001472C239|nr:serine/threonine-protein kinase [Labilithrix luteola]